MKLSIVKEYEIILLTTSIAIPIFIKLLNIKYISHSLLQYTNWNLVLIFINHYRNNKILNVFLTINSATIFVIYHIFHFTCKERIMTMANIPKWCTHTHINIASFFVHILPFLVYGYDFYKNRYIVEYNMGYNVILFNFIWAFQNFLSFDVQKAYFIVEPKVIYYIWCSVIVCNISIGYILETSKDISKST